MALPGAVNALGLGEIEVNSYLNQPFRGRIALLSPSDDELKGMTVALAPADEFDRAGVPYPIILGRLRFRLSHSDKGQPFVKVVSSLPISEPYLRFIVEVKTPSRRMLRQYTVLLDPPGAYNHLSTGAQQDTVAANSDARSGSSRPAGAMLGSAGTYGPTEKQETLWSIANRLRPDESVSVQQMMLALLNANPDAFEGRNVNNLRAGVMLQVPDSDQIQAIAPPDALRAVRQQNSDQGAGPAAASGPSPAPAQRAQGPQGAPSPQPQVDPALAVENERLRQRIELLEQDLLDMRRFVSDRDMSSGPDIPMQTSADDPETGAGDPAASLADDSRAPENRGPGRTSGDQPGGPAVEVTDRTDASVSGGATDGAVQEGAPLSRTADPKSAVEQKPSVNAKADKAEVQAEPKPKPKPKPKPRPAPPPEPGFLDDPVGYVLNDPIMMAAAGSGVVGLLSLALLAARRRRAKDEGDEDSADIADLDIGDLDVIDGEGDELPGANASGDGGSAGDQVAAAEVYMNNGRYQQAEEILSKALAADPRNDSLKLKLLEVYQEAGNADAFVTLANKVRSERGDSKDDPVWRQVVAMGAVVSPAHPMFTGGPASADAGGTGNADSADMPDMLDLSDLGLGDDDLDVLGDGGDGDSADLDLSDLGLGDDPSTADSAGAAGSDFDLDLGDIDLGDGDGGDDVLDAGEPGSLGGESAGDSDDLLDLGGAASDENEDFADLDLGALGSEMSMDDLGSLDGGSLDESEFGESGESFELDQLSGIDGLEFDSGESGETLTADEGDAAGGLDFGTVEAVEGLGDGLGDASDDADGLGLDVGDLGADLELGGGSDDDDPLGGADFELDTGGDEGASTAGSAGGSFNETMILDGLEFEEGTGSASPAEEMLPTADAGGDDEVGTKLDLAKAYIDMGDPDGALDLLNEVMREGSSSQKQEAQALAADLN
ncbi:MAG: FimV/HubP family polar landmark protein [Gammaproteobacteria bacterium]